MAICFFSVYDLYFLNQTGGVISCLSTLVHISAKLTIKYNCVSLSTVRIYPNRNNKLQLLPWCFRVVFGMHMFRIAEAFVAEIHAEECGYVCI